MIDLKKLRATVEKSDSNPSDDWKHTAVKNAHLIELLDMIEAAKIEAAVWRNDLANLLEMVEQHADFSNGVTDPTGTIDEGRVFAAEQLSRYRKAIDAAMRS